MKKKTIALQGIFKATLFAITFCTLSSHSIASITALSEEGGATYTKPSRRVSLSGAVTALEAADHFRLAAAGHDTEKAMREGNMRGVEQAAKSAEKAFSDMTREQLIAYLSDSD